MTDDTYREGDEAEVSEKQGAVLRLADPVDEELKETEEEEGMEEEEDDTAPTQDDIVARKMAEMSDDEEEDEEGDEDDEDEPESAAEESPEMATAVLIVKLKDGSLDVITRLDGFAMEHEAKPHEVYSLIHEAYEAGLVSRIISGVNHTLPSQLMGPMHKLFQSFASAMRQPNGGGFRPPAPRKGPKGRKR